MTSSNGVFFSPVPGPGANSSPSTPLVPRLWNQSGERPVAASERYRRFLHARIPLMRVRERGRVWRGHWWWIRRERWVREEAREVKRVVREGNSGGEERGKR